MIGPGGGGGEEESGGGAFSGGGERAVNGKMRVKTQVNRACFKFKVYDAGNATRKKERKKLNHCLHLHLV